MIVADARPATRESDSFDLVRWSDLAWLVPCSCGVEHLLLHDGAHAVRIDLVEGTLRAGPVCFHYQVEGLASAERPLRALGRLLSLTATGAFDPSLFAPPPRRARRVLELRVHDARASGADHQAIARMLFGASIAPDRWRVHSSSFRYRVQRLATAARAMAAGGWRALLTA